MSAEKAVPVSFVILRGTKNRKALDLLVNGGRAFLFTSELFEVSFLIDNQGQQDFKKGNKRKKGAVTNQENKKKP